MQRLTSRLILLALLPLPFAGSAQPGQHLLRVEQPATAPAELLLAVEIPANTRTKYEIGEDGLVRVDRFLSTPMAYPANYGSIPRSLAGDDDPLDALVLTRDPLHPGTLIRFRPIGVLRMTDAGDSDDKIIGVPADSVDPDYTRIKDINDLDKSERERIRAFFEVYKRTPGPDANNPVALSGFGDAAAAREIVIRALERYKIGEALEQPDGAVAPTPAQPDPETDPGG